MYPPAVGCCGWTQAQPLYLQQFPTIELQTTFYQPPANKVAERWKAIAPPGFTYCMKAWQIITHTPSSPTYRRLKFDVRPEEHELYGSFRPTDVVQIAWERTREIAGILGAAVIVFQCPKSFLPTRENIRNLNAFFQGIDRGGHKLAWEPRGPDWRPQVIREICAENDLIHCVDPFCDQPQHGQSIYWRLHGRTGYRYRFTDEDLEQLRTMLSQYRHLSGPNFVMFNNVYSREDALRFLK